jgi:hypothetical protein
MMKFTTPPNWPTSPEGWMPDPGWRPDASWPPAPPGWHFWVNDYGVPIDGPAGLYGSTRRNATVGAWLVAVGVGVLALLMGVGIGSASDSSTAAPAALAEPLLPTPTVTTTLVTPGPTVTATATTTAKPKPAPTVTVTKKVEVAVPFAETDGGGSDDVYYANCSEAREAGAAPLRRGDPGYASHLDRDDDGVACE